MLARDPPPAYSRKPSLLEPQPSSPTSTFGINQDVHQRFMPEDAVDDDNGGERRQQIVTSHAVNIGDVLPPQYKSLDDRIHTFTLRTPFILAIGSSTFARYHSQAEYSKSGRPFRLHVRRLLGSESRRLGKSAQTDDNERPSVRKRRSSSISYDADMTLYTAFAAPSSIFAPSSSAPAEITIRGRARGTLPGQIRIIFDGKAKNGRARILHVTRNHEGDSLRDANEARMNKWGYKPEDEVTTTPLFRVSSGTNSLEWRDEQRNNALIASESEKDGIRITALLDAPTRDILVMCWLTKQWAVTNEQKWQMQCESAMDGAPLLVDVQLQRATTIV